MAASAVSGYGCRIDDRRALLQVGQCRLDHVKVGKDVRPEGSFKLFGRDVKNGLLRMLLSSVINKHVELAKLVKNLLDRLITETLVAGITGNRNARPALLFNQLLRLLGIPLLFQVKDGNVRAFARKRQRRDVGKVKTVVAKYQLVLARKISRAKAATQSWRISCSRACSRP